MTTLNAPITKWRCLWKGTIIQGIKRNELTSTCVRPVPVRNERVCEKVKCLDVVHTAVIIYFLLWDMKVNSVLCIMLLLYIWSIYGIKGQHSNDIVANVMLFNSVWWIQTLPRPNTNYIRHTEAILLDVVHVTVSGVVNEL